MVDSESPLDLIGFCWSLCRERWNNPVDLQYIGLHWWYTLAVWRMTIKMANSCHFQLAIFKGTLASATSDMLDVITLNLMCAWKKVLNRSGRPNWYKLAACPWVTPSLGKLLPWCQQGCWHYGSCCPQQGGMWFCNVFVCVVWRPVGGLVPCDWQGVDVCKATGWSGHRRSAQTTYEDSESRCQGLLCCLHTPHKQFHPLMHAEIHTHSLCFDCWPCWADS